MDDALTRLDDTAREQFIADHPGWTLVGEEIRKTFVFDGFASEAADHHPDIDIRWNKVTLTLTTHAEDALTARDTDLASVIEAW